jgi:hypothetical protein
LSLVTLGLVSTMSAVALQPSAALPPTEPDCVPLVAGSTGLFQIGGDIPSSEGLAGEEYPGFGAETTGEVARTLPRGIVFRTETDTFSREYAFALRQGHLYVALATEGVLNDGAVWHNLDLPACLDGKVSAISADHKFINVLGPRDQVYSHDMPGGDLSAERWTWRYGPYFWAGSGLTLWPDVKQWAASEFSGGETFTDTSGRKQSPIGVGTMYVLRGDGKHITLLDPWLPQDESRETCVPRDGRLRVAGISGSGSVVMAIGTDGSVWTRLYDFDVSGGNTVFGSYSWERDRPASDTRWQMPGPRWLRHATPRGSLTNRVSISKTGDDASERVLRVEGRSPSGATGYFEKALTDSRWHFVRTWRKLTGTPLKRVTFEATGLDSPTEVRPYSGAIDGLPAAITSFTAHCTERTTLRIQVSAQEHVGLILHSSDGLRQEMRDAGLTDVPREYNGAIEVPLGTWRNLASASPAVRDWIETNLDGRFTTSPIRVTATRIRFLVQCWEFTLNGDPANVDMPAILPDAGVAVGRLTEMNADGRSPSTCVWATP